MEASLWFELLIVLGLVLLTILSISIMDRNYTKKERIKKTIKHEIEEAVIYKTKEESFLEQGLSPILNSEININFVKNFIQKYDHLDRAFEDDNFLQFFRKCKEYNYDDDSLDGQGSNESCECYTFSIESDGNIIKMYYWFHGRAHHILRMKADYFKKPIYKKEKIYNFSTKNFEEIEILETAN